MYSLELFVIWLDGCNEALHISKVVISVRIHRLLPPNVCSFSILFLLPIPVQAFRNKETFLFFSVANLKKKIRTNNKFY